MAPRIAVYRDDELYLILRNGVYYARGQFDGNRVYKSCKTSNLTRAKEFLANLRSELTHGWRGGYEQPAADWRSTSEAMHARHKANAVKRGIPFDIKPGDIYALMKATDFKCAISGVPFARREVSDGKRDPWAPSLDRIENRQGYSLENVRVVCLAANIAMQDWGLDTLLRLSRGIHRSSLTLAQEPPQTWLETTADSDKPLISLVKSE